MPARIITGEDTVSITLFKSSKLRSALVAVLAGLGLSACASTAMMDAPEPAFVSAPPADQATVVFLRPSNFGFAIQSVVYDVTNDSGTPALVGIVSASKKIGLTTPPGQRRFMVVSEAADFMDAELVAGKTYYALVTPRMGLWRARFSLRPMNWNDPELAGYLGTTNWVQNTSASSDWSRDNMDSVQAKKAEYLVEWLAKPDKPILRAGDGK
jgi:hypothetical protein